MNLLTTHRFVLELILIDSSLAALFIMHAPTIILGLVATSVLAMPKLSVRQEGPETIAQDCEDGSGTELNSAFASRKCCDRRGDTSELTIMSQEQLRAEMLPQRSGGER